MNALKNLYYFVGFIALSAWIFAFNQAASANTIDTLNDQTEKLQSIVGVERQ